MPEITPTAVELWIKNVPTGEFHYKDIMGLRKELTPENDQALRRIVSRLAHADDPVLEPVGKRDGIYRPVAEPVMPIDWQSVEANHKFPVSLPFNLCDYVHIYPNTVIVVAGSKSAGKTGFLLRTVVQNMNKTQTILLSNMEGGKEQLRDRLSAMKDIEMPTPAPFYVYPVMENFHDYIKWPDSLYVIDYIDAPEGSDFYLIGAAITKVRKKLNNSVAVIGLQKPSGRDTAYGGEMTLKEATLYIALNNGKLKIVDAKVPAQNRINPRNMQWKFNYSEAGTAFTEIEPYYGDSVPV